MSGSMLPPWLTPEDVKVALETVTQPPPPEAEPLLPITEDEEEFEVEVIPPARKGAKDEEGLLPRQRLFADEWLTGEGTGKQFNALAAWKYAGYAVIQSNPYTNPSKMLRHPRVSAYIKKRLTEMTMTAEEVMMRLTELARTDYRNIIRKNPQNGDLELNPDGVMEHAKFIKSFAKDSNGNPKVDLQDPMQALRDLIRVLGMAKEGLEIGGMGGGPVRMELVFVGPNGNEPYNPPGSESLPPPEDFSDIDALEGS